MYRRSFASTLIERARLERARARVRAERPDGEGGKRGGGEERKKIHVSFYRAARESGAEFASYVNVRNDKSLCPIREARLSARSLSPSAMEAASSSR